MDLNLQLSSAFRHSKAVHAGGPGGFPVKVGDETWNIGLTPSGQYFASNGVSNNAAPYCGYHLDHWGRVWRNRTATPAGVGWIVDANGYELVTSEEEIRWLIDLICAAETAGWGAEIDLRPRPTS